MNKKINVGVIGAGRMAALHLNVLNVFENVVVKAIASTPKGEKRCIEICKKYKIPNHYSDYNIMLNNENLDCVFIAVSVVKMFEVTKEVLSKGIHSFVEKPPGLYLHETKELAKIANDKSLITSVGLQRRFYSHIQYAKDYIKSNGKLVSVVVEAPEKFAQIKEKGKFSDEVLSRWVIANGIHCIDLLLHFGGTPLNVHTFNKSVNETVHPDALHALVEFEDGVTGHYISNWMSPGGWSVKLYCDGYRIDIQPIEEGKIIFPDGTEKPLQIELIDKEYKPGVYAQDRSFIDAVCEGKKVPEPSLTLEGSIKLIDFCTKLIS